MATKAAVEDKGSKEKAPETRGILTKLVGEYESRYGQLK